MDTIEELENEYKECCVRKSKARKHYENELRSCTKAESALKFASLQRESQKQPIFIKYGNAQTLERVEPIAPVNVGFVGIYSTYTLKVKVRIIKTGTIRTVSYYDLLNENCKYLNLW